MFGRFHRDVENWRCHNISLISDQIWGSNTQAGSYLSTALVRSHCEFFQCGSGGGAGYRRWLRWSERAEFAKNSAHIEPDKWFLGDCKQETDEHQTDYWWETKDFLKLEKCSRLQTNADLQTIKYWGKKQMIWLRSWNINQSSGSWLDNIQCDDERNTCNNNITSSGSQAGLSPPPPVSRQSLTRLIITHSLTDSQHGLNINISHHRSVSHSLSGVRPVNEGQIN